MSIFFEQGKFLVKAPIGAGKSFLFFDGPIYGLYKYAGRTMLNITSKEGFIKLLFEVDGQHYLIIRNLKKWRVKESCTTTLYTIPSKELDFPSTWLREGDIQKILQEDGKK